MKPRDLLSILLHRPGALCQALVDPLLLNGDGLELAGGYNGLSSRLVGRGNPGGSDNEAASRIQDNCQQVLQNNTSYHSDSCDQSS